MKQINIVLPINSKYSTIVFETISNLWNNIVNHSMLILPLLF